MDKTYTRINWQNAPSEATALNETNLNKMDSAIDTIDDRVVTHDTQINNLEYGKVDKEAGKGLSTNDYDNTAKGIVDGVTSALANKVDKEAGKGLSTNDYTDSEKAIVESVPEFKDDVLEAITEGTYDVLKEYGTFASSTQGGITFTWDETTRSYTVTGSDSSRRAVNIIDSTSEVPDFLKAGTYIATCSTTDENAFLQVTIYDSGVATTYDIKNDTEIVVPDTVTGIRVRVFAERNVTINGVVSNMSFKRENADGQLSTTSHNPVQNKVVTAAINNKVDKENGKGLFNLSTMSFSDNTSYTGDEVAYITFRSHSQDPSEPDMQFAIFNGMVAITNSEIDEIFD